MDYKSGLKTETLQIISLLIHTAPLRMESSAIDFVISAFKLKIDCILFVFVCEFDYLLFV